MNGHTPRLRTGPTDRSPAAQRQLPAPRWALPRCLAASEKCRFKRTLLGLDRAQRFSKPEEPQVDFREDLDWSRRRNRTASEPTDPIWAPSRIRSSVSASSTQVKRPIWSSSGADVAMIPTVRAGLRDASSLMTSTGPAPIVRSRHQIVIPGPWSKPGVVNNVSSSRLRNAGESAPLVRVHSSPAVLDLRDGMAVFGRVEEHIRTYPLRRHPYGGYLVVICPSTGSSTMRQARARRASAEPGGRSPVADR